MWSGSFASTRSSVGTIAALCGLGVAAARLPVVPRAQVHQRFGVERRDVVVVRELRRDLAHGGGVGRVERHAVGLGVGRIAGREREDQRLLARARLAGERLRVADRRIGGRDRVLLHRHVDVRAEHQCLAPEAHRAIRVEPLRLAERAARLVVIERVGEAEALIEIRLRLRVRRGDLVVDGAEPVPQRRIAVGELGRGRDRRQGAGRHFDLRKAQQPGHPARRTRRAADRGIEHGRKRCGGRRCRLRQSLGLDIARGRECEQPGAAEDRCAAGQQRQPEQARFRHDGPPVRWDR